MSTTIGPHLTPVASACVLSAKHTPRDFGRTAHLDELRRPMVADDGEILGSFARRPHTR